jgi:DMSO/TMAO reductase YedYZ molybdopterin-dependent catalytic subunit
MTTAPDPTSGPQLDHAAGLTRRGLLRASAALGLAALPGAAASAAAAAPGGATVLDPVAAGPIRKPLPAELFTVFGTNAETRWESLRGQGHHTPIDRFFVRNHTATPIIDVNTWRLKLFGSGLRTRPTQDRPIEFSYADLRALPAHEISAFIECAGNGRSFYATQQGQAASGTAWKLGAIGVARWRGVRLSTVLRRAGLDPAAVDVMPSGLDAPFVSGGVDLGPVRRPFPIAKALDDVLLAYQMNGETLPPDHGFPVRVVVPSWIGIASIKWVGALEVSAEPLSSPWNTQFYRLFGADHPAEGSPPLTRQTIKSAFELPWPATLEVGRRHRLTGRSWSGHGAVRTVEVSVNGGADWQRAQPCGGTNRTGWLRWELPWRPRTAGNYELLARATDETGRTQPDSTTFNTLGYLFDAVVRHPVVVA